MSLPQLGESVAAVVLGSLLPNELILLMGAREPGEAGVPRAVPIDMVPEELRLPNSRVLVTIGAGDSITIGCRP
jgi:hypothetical protein